MRPIRLNVVLIPTPAVAARARHLSRTLSRQGSLFALDRSHHPHISLYMSDYPPAVIRSVRPALARAVRGAPPCVLRALAVRRNDEGYIEVRFARTKELRALQNKIIAALNPLRGGILAHRESVQRFPAAGRHNTQLFGYPAVGREFRPHLTLTRLASPRPLSRVRPADFSFRAVTLGIYRTGPHGTAVKRLSVLRLNSASRQKKAAL